MRWYSRMSRKKRIGLPVAVVAAAVLILVAGRQPRIAWRIDLLLAKARGRLVETTWRDVSEIILPGVRWLDADLNVDVLLTTGNPHLAVYNRFSSESDRSEGAGLFRSRCASWHGADGRGSDQGPSLAGGLRRGNSDLALFHIISGGVPGTAMIGVSLGTDSIWRLAAFVRSLAAAAPALPQGSTAAPVAVEYNRLLDGELDHGNWLHYSGSYDGARHSPLARIDRSNIGDLGLRWVLQLTERKVETTPLVVDGIMYLTEPPNNVVAVEAATGSRLWFYSRDLPADLQYLCCGLVNRGVAVLDGRLYFGTLDAHLVALDARTGQVRWDIEVADYREGYSITSAPLALDRIVVTGVAGAEYGIRGFLDAYDAATGERVWRFHTAPGPGEPGHETWLGSSWLTGGAATWLTGTFDPGLNLLYWGVANPSPLYAGEGRVGDNLFTNSVIALDAGTGALRWHFQFTPHDEHDWDANSIPVLIDAPFHGRTRKLLLMATKNAFFYVLDRETGRFLLAREFAAQTWADGIDSVGRPIVRDDSRPTLKGTLVSPGVGGATSWWSPSYSAESGLFYIPVSEWPSVFFRTPRNMAEGIEGPWDAFGSTTQRPMTPPRLTALRALDPETAEIRWEYLFDKTSSGPIGGVLTTAGGLVFAGAGDEFVALDDASGRKLWSVRLGGDIVAAPITFLHQGRQYIAIAAGAAVFTFGLPTADPDPGGP